MTISQGTTRFTPWQWIHQTPLIWKSGCHFNYKSGGGNERNISACACITPTMQRSFVFLGRNNHVFHRFEMDFYHLFMIPGVSNLLYSQAQLLLKLCVCWKGPADVWQEHTKLQKLNQHFRSRSTRSTTPHLERLETNFFKWDVVDLICWWWKRKRARMWMHQVFALLSYLWILILDLFSFHRQQVDLFPFCNQQANTNFSSRCIYIWFMYVYLLTKKKSMPLLEA